MRRSLYFISLLFTLFGMSQMHAGQQSPGQPGTFIAPHVESTQDEPLPDDLRKLQRNTRIAMGAIIVAQISLLLALMIAVAAAEILLYPVFIGLAVGGLIGGINLWRGNRLLKEYQNLPAGRKKNHGIPFIKKQMLLSAITILPYIGLLILMFRGLLS